ncbi:hypothetical protein ABH922_001044 [Rhodococcus sp. 27YEA15]|uniref:hypothetical protein n=1 Tax=Rhodococcus sp. 27YEA15 TaxID=3156259 RepID=UPI003C7B8D18
MNGEVSDRMPDIDGVGGASVPPGDDSQWISGDAVSSRRSEISARVRAWCEVGVIERTRPPLSGEAALLLAGAFADEATREVMRERRRVGRGFPLPEPVAELRQVTDERDRISRRLAATRIGPVQVVLERRIQVLERKLQAHSSAVVRSQRHFAGSVRAIRKDRRDGLHLEIEQREALFAGLCATPIPLIVSVGVGAVAAGTQTVAARIAEQLAEGKVSGRLAGTGRRITEILDGLTDTGPRRSGPYDALRYLAGNLYDRVNGSPAWHSDHFVVQRNQLDLADEITQISVDTVALRSILVELSHASSLARDESTRLSIDARRGALEVVWDQLVERVAALARIADLVTRADAQLSSGRAAAHAASLDSRIDDLLARSGSRELSAANTHHVGDQFDGVEELMFAHRAALYGDIAVLTSGNDHRSP